VPLSERGARSLLPVMLRRIIAEFQRLTILSCRGQDRPPRPVRIRSWAATWSACGVNSASRGRRPTGSHHGEQPESSRVRANTRLVGAARRPVVHRPVPPTERTICCRGRWSAAVVSRHAAASGYRVRCSGRACPAGVRRERKHGICGGPGLAGRWRPSGFTAVPVRPGPFLGGPGRGPCRG
jgi:hypothetical protein